LWIYQFNTTWFYASINTFVRILLKLSQDIHLFMNVSSLYLSSLYLSLVFSPSKCYHTGQQILWRWPPPLWCGSQTQGFSQLIDIWVMAILGWQCIGNYRKCLWRNEDQAKKLIVWELKWIAYLLASFMKHKWLHVSKILSQRKRKHALKILQIFCKCVD